MQNRDVARDNAIVYITKSIARDSVRVPPLSYRIPLLDRKDTPYQLRSHSNVHSQINSLIKLQIKLQITMKFKIIEVSKGTGKGEGAYFLSIAFGTVATEIRITAKQLAQIALRKRLIASKHDPITNDVLESLEQMEMDLNIVEHKAGVEVKYNNYLNEEVKFTPAFNGWHIEDSAVVKAPIRYTEEAMQRTANAKAYASMKARADQAFAPVSISATGIVHIDEPTPEVVVEVAEEEQK
jgi:hypothetical protein